MKKIVVARGGVFVLFGYKQNFVLFFCVYMT